MIATIVAIALCSLLFIVSCGKDDSSNRGKLEVRCASPYVNGTWKPETLYLYSIDDKETVLQVITTVGNKTAKAHLLTGHYILKDESDELELVLQIMPDRTTKVYYYRGILTLDDEKYAATSGIVYSPSMWLAQL